MASSTPSTLSGAPQYQRPRTRIRVIGWLSLFFQLGIIAMGGTVRLTGSGLGCPTWPTCTEDSWFPTEEQGIHGVIEIVNRFFSTPLLLVAILAVVFSLQYRRTRKDLLISSILVLVISLVQGLLGWLTVGSSLNSWVVGAKYLISASLVGIAAYFVLASYRSGARKVLAVPKWFMITAHLTSVFLLITVMLGVLTTGSGPHSGDANVTERNGLEWELLSHLHAVPGYILFALLLVLIWGGYSMRAQRSAPLRTSLALMAVVLVQIIVGVAQARLALPPALVGIHMVLGAVSVALMVAVIGSIKTEQTDESSTLSRQLSTE